MSKLPPAFTLLMSPSLLLIAFCSEWKKKVQKQNIYVVSSYIQPQVYILMSTRC